MFRRIFGRPTDLLIVASAALLLPTPASPGLDRDAASGEVTVQPTAQNCVTQFYDRLRDRGEFSNALIPWVVHVKRVCGRKLQHVKFMHRDPSGVGFDFVGAAVEVELHPDESGRAIVVIVRESEIRTKDVQWEFAERFFEVPVPETWPGVFSDSWTSFTGGRHSLTAEQKQFFADELYTTGQKKLPKGSGSRGP